MEPLIIEKTRDTPQVIFDKENDRFEIWGKSLPEDVKIFYKPVLEWLENYIQNPNQETVVSFKYKYFNTASSKILLDIFLKLDEIYDNGHTIKVAWYSLDSDEDMVEAGVEYSELVGLPFDFYEYSREEIDTIGQTI